MVKKTLQLAFFWSGVNAIITYSIYRYHIKSLHNENDKSL
jgi:hypothetical protein